MYVLKSLGRSSYRYLNFRVQVSHYHNNQILARLAFNNNFLPIHDVFYVSTTFVFSLISYSTGSQTRITLRHCNVEKEEVF